MIYIILYHTSSNENPLNLKLIQVYTTLCLNFYQIESKELNIMSRCIQNKQSGDAIFLGSDLAETSVSHDHPHPLAEKVT